MISTDESESPPTWVADLAGTGRMAAAVAAAGPAERRRLYAGAYVHAIPAVLNAVTRKVEKTRRHGDCLRGMTYLRSACLDGFYDDVDALIEHLFAAREPIEDLPAWLTFWAPRAAVDGHRRRRGARGALQRPRMTMTLAAQLGHDNWLMDLALQILTWVGIPATAGAEMWPWDAWVQRRITITGDRQGSTPARLATEVCQVLEVLRNRPDWFAAHVERPMSYKPAPVAPAPDDRGPAPYEMDETVITELAGAALRRIEDGLGASRDPVATVAGVLDQVFLSGTGADELNRAPGTGGCSTEQLQALLADPESLAPIVDLVLEIVRGRPEVPGGCRGPRIG